jgi:hypothetical protein
MRINNESLAVLKGTLPRGSVQKIRERLLIKNINFSRQYIYRCLDPSKPAYSSIIIDEAILLCEELKRNIKVTQNRVSQLKKTTR